MPTNSFTVTLDLTLIELQDAYRKHFNLPSDAKVIKSDIGKMISELAAIEIDKLNIDREDDGQLDTGND